ncbi:hypothetical protein ACFSOZ_22595 [Mesorhizobium newzealandense]|uniref:Uncharacterized protein n=1 Tax=Mesorhizobium newzealandense TaxID=1300302 RepID=A0ABW4UFQ2_9HYPH
MLMALAEPGKVASLTLLRRGGLGPRSRPDVCAAMPEPQTGARFAPALPPCPPPQSAFGAHRRMLCEMRGRPGQVPKLVEIAAAMTNGRSARRHPAGIVSTR